MWSDIACSKAGPVSTRTLCPFFLRRFRAAALVRPEEAEFPSIECGGGLVGGRSTFVPVFFLLFSQVHENTCVSLQSTGLQRKKLKKLKKIKIGSNKTITIIIINVNHGTDENI